MDFEQIGLFLRSVTSNPLVRPLDNFMKRVHHKVNINGKKLKNYEKL